MSENNSQTAVKSVTKSFNKRVRGCPLSIPGAPKVDYKDVKLLSRFISMMGRVLPARITGTCPKKQRELKIAIKRARHLALLPFKKES